MEITTQLPFEDHNGNKVKLFCAILGAFYTCIYYMYFIVLYTHLRV